jgi:hypothetical protein
VRHVVEERRRALLDLLGEAQPNSRVDAVGRDFAVREPGARREQEEVGAGRDRAVHGREIDRMSRHDGRARDGRCGRRRGDDPRGWPAARCEGGENESGGEEPDTRTEGAHVVPYHGLSFARTPLAPVSVTEQLC